MHKSLDLRGLTCPEPVLRTKKTIDDQTINSVEVLVDDEVNVQNLERLARSQNLSWKTSAEGNFFKVEISRPNKENSTDSDTDQAPPANAHDHSRIAPSTVQSAQNGLAQTTLPRGGGTIVFLAKDTFGQGGDPDKDHDFSHKLIDLFLQTIQQSGLKPRAVLLANSGVKLLDPDASTYKVLSDLKADGVTVLACGLCLDYYELKAKIPVEQITNMFAICEYLFAADLVLSP